MVSKNFLCCTQELLSSAVRRIAAFDLLPPPYPLSRCCGDVWGYLCSHEHQRLGVRTMQRRVVGKRALLQGTVGRDARIRSCKQHDLTPKREDGNSSVSPRKFKRRTEDLAQPKSSPEPRKRVFAFFLRAKKESRPRKGEIMPRYAFFCSREKGTSPSASSTEQEATTLQSFACGKIQLAAASPVAALTRHRRVFHSRDSASLPLTRGAKGNGAAKKKPPLCKGRLGG